MFYCIWVYIVNTAVYHVIRFILPLSVLQMCVQPQYCWEPAKHCVTARQHLTDHYCCTSGYALLSKHTEENMVLLLRLTWANKHPELGLMLSQWCWWGFTSCSMWCCVRGVSVSQCLKDHGAVIFSVQEVQEDEDGTICSNITNGLPNNTVYHLRALEPCVGIFIMGMEVRFFKVLCSVWNIQIIH